MKKKKAMQRKGEGKQQHYHTGPVCLAKASIIKVSAPWTHRILTNPVPLLAGNPQPGRPLWSLFGPFLDFSLGRAYPHPSLAAPVEKGFKESRRRKKEEGVREKIKEKWKGNERDREREKKRKRRKGHGASGTSSHSDEAAFVHRPRDSPSMLHCLHTICICIQNRH